MISFLYNFHYVRHQRIFLPLFGISISIEEILITETIEYRWYKSKYLEGVSTSKDSTSRSSTCKRFKALFPIYFLKGSRDSKYVWVPRRFSQKRKNGYLWQWLPGVSLRKSPSHSFYLPSAAIITNRRKRDRASFANKSILLCGIMIEKRRRMTMLILFRRRQFWSMFFIEKPQDKLPQNCFQKSFYMQQQQP